MSAHVDHVQRLAAGIGRLGEVHYDVVLLDLNLPDGSGIESLHEVKAAAPNVPVVILTNMEDQEAAVAMVAEGAQDYVIKRHITSELLRRSIRYAIARQAAEASLRESEERYALAVAGARDGIWDWDLTRGEIHFSSRWFELLQLSEVDERSAPPCGSIAFILRIRSDSIRHLMRISRRHAISGARVPHEERRGPNDVGLVPGGRNPRRGRPRDPRCRITHGHQRSKAGRSQVGA